MSKVSTAYDNLIARIQAILLSADGWLQIPNAYDVPSNASGFLKQGYGLSIGTASNSRLQLAGQLSTKREFTVAIAREVFKTDGDADGYASVAKQLMEDLFLLIKDFETNIVLNVGQIFCEYDSDQGVQGIESGDFSGMFVSATFSVNLIEDLNN